MGDSIGASPGGSLANSPRDRESPFFRHSSLGAAILETAWNTARDSLGVTEPFFLKHSSLGVATLDTAEDSPRYGLGGREPLSSRHSSLGAAMTAPVSA